MPGGLFVLLAHCNGVRNVVRADFTSLRLRSSTSYVPASHGVGSNICATGAGEGATLYLMRKKLEIENQLEGLNTTPRGEVLGKDIPLPPKTPTLPLEDEAPFRGGTGD